MPDPDTLFLDRGSAVSRLKSPYLIAALAVLVALVAGVLALSGGTKDETGPTQADQTEADQTEADSAAPFTPTDDPFAKGSADAPVVTVVNEAGLVLAPHTRWHRDVTWGGAMIVDLVHDLARRAETLDDAIRIARERPVASSWAIAIGSAPGEGTTVTIRLPGISRGPAFRHRGRGRRPPHRR